VAAPALRQASISFNEREIQAMTYDQRKNDNFDIDPTTILLGLGYATSLCVGIGWIATLLI
jgi:hypothetical protein